MASLIINGVTMPEPKQGGLSISKEKIWSKNTGRGADGTMNGDVVARKFTLKVEWPILSDAQAEVVDKAIDPAYVKVKFRNPGTGKTVKNDVCRDSDLPGVLVCKRASAICRDWRDSD